MENKNTTNQQAGAPAETSPWVKVRESVARLLPDSLFPDAVREKFTAEKAALIALVVGVAGDIPVYLMTNYFGVFLVVALSLFGAYLGLYAMKTGADIEEKSLTFAEIGVALSILNILLIFFIMIPGIHAVNELEGAANDAMKQLDAMGSMF